MAHIHGDEPLLEYERPLTVAAPRILTPNLVVLLGSTSALAGLEMMRHMLTLQPGDQRRVTLVYIDTDDPPAPLIEFRRQHNNIFQEYPLRIAVPAGISNAALSTYTDQQNGMSSNAQQNAAPDGYIDQHTFIQQKVPQYFANGAGGIRNNGHVAACFNYQYIYDVLDRALVSLSRLSTDQNVSKVQEVQANIVAFLGGGTGSGILADIAIMVRDILTHRQYKQRLNLICMLPEPISGANLNDLRWRKSNAIASLLEVLAYSRAAAPDPVGGYAKYMRGRMHRLSNDPIANEVYLVGHASMDDAGDTARIVGLDLFQRTTDASGVGFLEHSKWVDRRTLGSTDDRGLPTMFGTSCPLEVRFPVEETATAFAQVSASYLLPLLASYQPAPLTIGEPEKSVWLKEWKNVARFDANASDPLTVKVDQFGRSEFEDVAQDQLDLLWAKLERYERATEAQIKEIIDIKERDELSLIKDTPQLDTQGVSLIDQRIQYLRGLQQEYTFVLNDLKEKEVPKVPSRPRELEDKLTHQSSAALLRRFTRDYSGAVTEAYSERLALHARAIRRRLLEKLLQDLNNRVQEALTQSLSWFRSAGADERAEELREKGMGSMAWHGRLEYPHPHQRHIFDLHTLRTQDDRSVAVERLYQWATGGDKAVEEKRAPDIQAFVPECVRYLARQSAASGDNLLSIDRQTAGRLADRVVDFFHDYYVQQFQDTNLFELLEKAAPTPRRDQPRSEQIRNYLLEHLSHMRGLMTSLVAFEAELWQEGLSTLDTSVYMGIHWHDGRQETLLFQTLDQLGPLTMRGQTPILNKANDPHRLQISYGQHAISLSTVRDFYLEQNSAMEYYQDYQRTWKESHGAGSMPVHSSGEAERLITDKNALGYGQPLVDLVVRRPHSVQKTPADNNQQHYSVSKPPFRPGGDNYEL